jgi:hypothetical protein
MYRKKESTADEKEIIRLGGNGCSNDAFDMSQIWSDQTESGNLYLE